MNFTRTLFVAVSLLVSASSSTAQEYPNKPVKILVGFSAGGAPDVVARALADRLSQILKQPFVVDNKAGAGGTLATAVAAKSPADGYTLVIGDVGQFAIAPFLFKNLQYDPVRDFSPVSMIASVPLVLAANASTTNIKSLDQLIQQAKASPGKLTYASSGVGSIHHIAMEVFKHEAGIDVLHIPYKGSSQSVPALIGGEVQLAMTSMPALTPFLESGKVNLLAVTSKDRIPNARTVPAIGESRKGFAYSAELGILAPKGVPAEVIEKLAAAVKVALDIPEVKVRFVAQGAIPEYMSPKQYGENIRQNLKKYKEAVDVAKIKAE